VVLVKLWYFRAHGKINRNIFFLNLTLKTSNWIEIRLRFQNVLKLNLNCSWAWNSISTKFKYINIKSDSWRYRANNFQTSKNILFFNFQNKLYRSNPFDFFKMLLYRCIMKNLFLTFFFLTEICIDHKLWTQRLWKRTGIREVVTSLEAPKPIFWSEFERLLRER
jgi:hypothetical protein